MSLAERMVEAAARASVALAYNDTLATDDDAFALWCANNPDLWRQELRCARAALTAALAVAEAEGAGMFVVPGKVRHLFGPVGERQRAEGWNSCRAATLAGRVSFYDPLTLLTQEAQDMGLYSPHPIR